MAKNNTTQKTPRQRDIALDILRVAATVAVVMLHVANQHFRESFPGYQWVVRMSYDAIVRWCVPVFLMISGALFLNPDRKISLKHLYGKNLLRIVVAFFVWSYIYSYSNINAGPWQKSFSLLMKGPSHLWFVKMLVGIYIAVPLLRAITVRRSIARYFIIVAAITTFVIPFVLDLCKQYYNLTTVSVVQRFYDSLYINITAGYSAYFVLGHYLYTYRPGLRLRCMFYLFGIVALIVILTATPLCSHHTGKPVNWFVNYLTPTVMALSAAVFVWVTSYPRNLGNRYNNWISKASRMCFGVYLVHVLLMRTASQYHIDTVTMNPLYFIPLYTIVIFCAAYVISFLLNKIPYLNRYIV